MQSLEVIFAPAEYAVLRSRDLSRTVCVVFDILRATSTMTTALANGAAGIVPVSDLEPALDLRRRHSDWLLAGERGGLRITAAQTGGIEFDFGNSPREFLPEQVQGRTIIATTTNGTRALKACEAARQVLIGAFLNMSCLAACVEELDPEELLLVCSGTVDQVSLEDVLGAGALCDRIWQRASSARISDSSVMARDLYRANANDLLAAVSRTCNGRKLTKIPELKDDVSFCVQEDIFSFVAAMEPSGEVRIVENPKN